MHVRADVHIVVLTPRPRRAAEPVVIAAMDSVLAAAYRRTRCTREQRHGTRRQAGRQAGRQAAVVPSSPSSLRGIDGVADRALILEDDSGVARALAGLVRSWGTHDVVIAASVAEGRVLLDPTIGLVLADLGLPDGRGIAVVRAARALDPQPIVIVVSGNWIDEELEELGDLGVCFVAKPPCPHTLHALVERLIVARSREERGLDEELDDAERAALDAALAATGGNISRAAQLLRVPRQRVQQLMDRHGRPRRRGA
jgi:DNA-binding NtrC family response regulator